jgi:chitinase
MSEMTPEEQAERIRRLQTRRGTAADPPSVRRKARRRHGMKTRLAVSALSVASFASLVGVMAMGGQSTSTVAAASKTSTAVATGTDSSATTATTAAPATSSSNTSSNTSSSTASSSTASSGTSSSSSTRAVTSTKGS